MLSYIKNMKKIEVLNMNITDKFKGVFVALNTIYDDNDNINTEEIKNSLRFIKQRALKAFMSAAVPARDFFSVQRSVCRLQRL